VAHRLRTISDSDFIIVLRDGKVKEEGKHSDLMAKEGLYWDLWNSQQTGGVGQGAGEGETAHSAERLQEMEAERAVVEVEETEAERKEREEREKVREDVRAS